MTFIYVKKKSKIIIIIQKVEFLLRYRIVSYNLK
jgi:hypothetical protein